MATTAERLGIVETKVENLDEKIDHLKVDVKEMHDCLDKTRDDLKAELQKMYGASCEQHAALAKDLSELKKLKEKNADFIVLNTTQDEGAGFGYDTNKVTVFDKSGAQFPFELKSKQQVAADIIDTILKQ
jgi:phosphopantothenoylcysteine decarboxylase/phosphopantothenate--cysteine ligase